MLRGGVDLVAVFSDTNDAGIVVLLDGEWILRGGTKVLLQ